MPKSAERARQVSEVGTAITRLHRENYGRGATTRTLEPTPDGSDS